ncbi:MAG: redoxin domain-containing protein [Candidatus Eisenbacteria bacterium]|uniref:Redoxin domain-containing protein n=1 Tax=Eiseniibacteriota bacterium TaxID=2212470 RepID=A0A538TY36_UNCEI|nr:MAG: redoxin domain-containing protein [Candidatus Eisenbacteria bacterium]
MRIRTALPLIACMAPALALAQTETKPTGPTRPPRPRDERVSVAQLRVAGRVYVGERAPDFELTSSRERTVVLSRLRGYLVLLHFTGDHRQFAALKGIDTTMTRLGFVMLGVSKDSPQALRAFAQREDIPFELLADPTGEISALYGLFDSVHGETEPGFVILDRTGTVRLALLGQSIPADQIVDLARFTLTNL